MDKKELIQNLKYVKLVIGNGFDLACNIKTRYRDFFEHEKNKHNVLNKWCNDFSSRVNEYVYFNSKIFDRSDFWINFDSSIEINFWDLFFFLISKEKTVYENWTWCDIEKIMELWLSDKKGNGFNSAEGHLDDVFKILNKTIPVSVVKKELLYLAAFCFKFNKEQTFSDIVNFYNFLLEELKKFEKNFGKYIKNQQSNDELNSETLASRNNFLEKTNKVIELLCGSNNLVSIDTFNYGYVHSDFMNLLHHINGNTESPIFGIDSNLFSPSDPRYIFSKTMRRMELDLEGDNVLEIKECENLVIFGSSLSSSDYSYFFSVFDKMSIADTNKNNKIVFAYKIYDYEMEQEIKKSLIKSVAILFEEYSKYKGSKEQPNRLLDRLTTQGKVLFYSIN